MWGACGSEELLPMLSVLWQVLLYWAVPCIVFLAFLFSRSLDYGMLINYKRHTSGFKEGYRSHWATEKLKQKQKQKLSVFFFFPNLVFWRKSRDGVNCHFTSHMFILIGSMHTYMYSFIREFMTLNDHKYYIYMIWKDKRFSIVWENIPC